VGVHRERREELSTGRRQVTRRWLELAGGEVGSQEKKRASELREKWEPLARARAGNLF
jgi:hypothetical protein